MLDLGSFSCYWETLITVIFFDDLLASLRSSFPWTDPSEFDDDELLPQDIESSSLLAPPSFFFASLPAAFIIG